MRRRGGGSEEEEEEEEGATKTSCCVYSSTGYNFLGPIWQTFPESKYRIITLHVPVH